MPRSKDIILSQYDSVMKKAHTGEIPSSKVLAEAIKGLAEDEMSILCQNKRNPILEDLLSLNIHNKELMTNKLSEIEAALSPEQKKAFFKALIDGRFSNIEALMEKQGLSSRRKNLLFNLLEPTFSDAIMTQSFGLKEGLDRSPSSLEKLKFILHNLCTSNDQRLALLMHVKDDFIAMVSDSKYNNSVRNRSPLENALDNVDDIFLVGEHFLLNLLFDFADKIGLWPKIAKTEQDTAKLIKSLQWMLEVNIAAQETDPSISENNASSARQIEAINQSLRTASLTDNATTNRFSSLPGQATTNQSSTTMALEKLNDNPRPARKAADDNYQKKTLKDILKIADNLYSQINRGAKIDLNSDAIRTLVAKQLQPTIQRQLEADFNELKENTLVTANVHLRPSGNMTEANRAVLEELYANRYIDEVIASVQELLAEEQKFNIEEALNLASHHYTEPSSGFMSPPFGPDDQFAAQDLLEQAKADLQNYKKFHGDSDTDIVYAKFVKNDFTKHIHNLADGIELPEKLTRQIEDQIDKVLSNHRLSENPPNPWREIATCIANARMEIQALNNDSVSRRP